MVSSPGEKSDHAEMNVANHAEKVARLRKARVKL
jgi:hypothetical protein